MARHSTIAGYYAEADLMEMGYDPVDHSFNTYSCDGRYVCAETLQELSMDPEVVKFRTDEVACGRLGPRPAIKRNHRR